MEEEKERDVDMEEEDGKKFKTKPIASDFNGLPDIIIGSVVELVKITKQVDISTSDVNGLWNVFKVQNLTGKKYYKDQDAVHSHFINWSKTQKIENGKQYKTTTVGKSIKFDKA